MHEVTQQQLASSPASGFCHTHVICLTASTTGWFYCRFLLFCNFVIFRSVHAGGGTAAISAQPRLEFCHTLYMFLFESIFTWPTSDTTRHGTPYSEVLYSKIPGVGDFDISNHFFVYLFYGPYFISASHGVQRGAAGSRLKLFALVFVRCCRSADPWESISSQYTFLRVRYLATTAIGRVCWNTADEWNYL